MRLELLSLSGIRKPLEDLELGHDVGRDMIDFFFQVSQVLFIPYFDDYK